MQSFDARPEPTGGKPVHFNSVAEIHDAIMGAPWKMEISDLTARAQAAYAVIREPRVLFYDAAAFQSYKTTSSCWCSVFRVIAPELVNFPRSGREPADVAEEFARALPLVSSRHDTDQAFDIFFVPARLDLFEQAVQQVAQVSPHTAVMGYAWGPKHIQIAACSDFAGRGHHIMSSHMMCDAAIADKIYAEALGLAGMERLRRPV